MMQNKQAQEEERRDFDAMRSQLMTLQQRLGDQASYEAEMEQKSKRGGFFSGAMMPKEKGVYFDDYARKN